MKMLMLASVASMIDQFNMPNIKLLLDMGYQVDVACNFKEGNTCSNDKIVELKNHLRQLGVDIYQIDFSRDIKNVKKNVIAYKQVKVLMRKNDYEFVHCHSPIGGLIARIAGKSTNTRVIYTAHGFHFYKGAPLKNWMMYYPIEWLCANWTDTLITINQEDFMLAKKHMHAKHVVYIHGIGIDLTKFNHCDISKSDKRQQLGIPDDAVILLSVGELNVNKNHEVVIKAIKDMDVYYLIAGIGNKEKYLQQLINEQEMTDRIQLLGFRTDIDELYAVSDVFVFPSFREGLSVALMEAMASGLPCVVGDIRGNTDLIDDNGGALFLPSNTESVNSALYKVLGSDYSKAGMYNKRKIEKFSTNVVMEEMKEIYRHYAK